MGILLTIDQTGDYMNQAPLPKTPILEGLFAKRNQVLEAITRIDAEAEQIRMRLDQHMRELNQRHRELIDDLHHVDALLKSEGWLPGSETQESIKPRADHKHPAADAANDLLARAAEPLHYRELATRLIEQGIVISDKNPAATLLSQIARDARFKRVGRGTYGLASWKSIRNAKSKRLPLKKGASPSAR